MPAFKDKMLLLVPILLMVTSMAASDTIRQPKEIAQRRQILAYTNNIVHETPYYQDQAAQSSVKVNYNPTFHNQGQQNYNNQGYVVKKSPNYQNQNYDQNSQSFNVGYSVRFTNSLQPKPTINPPLPKTRINNFDDGEIITGTRKINEQVQGPHLEMSAQDFVAHSLIEGKKHKLSGIKPKTRVIPNYQNPNTLLKQANLSPITQKYYKVLEQAKPQIQNAQDLQQRYSWRNLSPGVEIIRSTEVPTVSQKYTDNVNFDHFKALGKSQEFDFSNALESSSSNSNNQYYRQRQPQIQVDTTLLREPIHVDTRYLDEVMKNQQNTQETYLQGQYRTIPLQLQEQDTDQSRYQYKIYGKPQPMSTLQIEQSQRQPRYVISNLQTNLRPPPLGNYQRRILVV